MTPRRRTTGYLAAAGAAIAAGFVTGRTLVAGVRTAPATAAIARPASARLAAVRRAADPRALSKLRAVAAEAPSRPTPDPIRELLLRAAATDDPEVLRYCEEVLAEWIGNDPERALRVLDWIRSTTARPELDVLFAALSAAEAFQDPRVVEAVTRLLETDDDGPRRALAAFAMRSLRRLAPETIDRLLAVAKGGPPEEVLFGLAQTIGAVMDHDRGGTGYDAALLTLAGIPAVRPAALEILGLNDPPVTPEQVRQVSEWVLSDPDPQTRAVAAAALGSPSEPARPEVLRLFEQAYAVEGDPYVRHVLLIESARAGGAEAETVLERMGALDPYFADDVREFRDLLRREPDWERVWLAKGELDERAQRTRPWEGCTEEETR